MQILVVLGHPNPCSLNHAITDTVIVALKELGHTVVFHDLYAEKFNPTLEQAEMQTTVDPLVRRHTEDLAGADGIVLVHPVWWGMPPAIVKGWIDRVFRVGVAYRFQTVTDSIGAPVGLLKAKAAVIFNTSNTPQQAEELRCKDVIGNLWQTCIFDTCGVKAVKRKLFSPVVASTPEQRQRWLKEAADIVKSQFANP